MFLEFIVRKNSSQVLRVVFVGITHADARRKNSLWDREVWSRGLKCASTV